MFYNILIALYNVLLLLVPYSLNIHGITYSKILLVYSLFISIYLFIKKKINLKEIFKNTTIKYISSVYLVLLIVVIISVVINTLIDKEFVLSNYFEVFRTLEYYLIFFNYYILLKDNNKKSFNISMIILILVNVIISFFQFYNFWGLNELYVKYIAPTQYKTLVNGYKWPRAVALAGNPNVLGFLFALFSIYILTLIFNNKKKWYLYFLYLIISISIFLTSSRTSYIAFIIANGLYIFLKYFKFKKQAIIKTIKVCIMFIMFQLILLFLLPNSYTWRIKTIINFSDQSSWQERVNNSKDFYNNIVDGNSSKNNNENDQQEISIETDEILKEKNNSFNLIIGNGPDKNKKKRKSYFDNEWNMILFNYGIIGVITFLLVTILPVFSTRKNKKFNYALYISLIISNYIYMIAAASYHCYLLFGFVMILISISLISDFDNVKKDYK